jgi:hypothetical protein
MLQPSIKALKMTAGSANAIALSQAVGGAGNLTLNGATVSGGVATIGTAGTTLPSRRVIITSASNSDNGVVFTVYGTNRAGLAISETITGVTTTAVQSAYDYQTVTQVAANGSTVGNITVGTNGVSSTDWFALDVMAVVFNVGGAVNGAAGTTYTIETTFDDFTQVGFATSGTLAPQQWSTEPYSNVPPTVFPLSTYQGVAGQQVFNWVVPSYGLRLTVNSGTGLVTIWCLQSGIAAR